MDDYLGSLELPVSEDALDQLDTVSIEDIRPSRTSQLHRAGVADETDCCTFMEMQGRNTFVTEV